MFFATARPALADTRLAALIPGPNRPAPAEPEDIARFVAGFRDNAGHRRAVDVPLLAWLMNARAAPRAASDTTAIDARAWWALHGGPRPAISSSGPLIPEPQRGGIELWTEAELSTLHALWNLALRDRDTTLIARCESAARWLMAEIQPDNATNHPWAIHVFAHLSTTADATTSSDATLYAETLLHNTIIAGQGEADRFSAAILLDAALRLSEAPPS